MVQIIPRTRPTVGEQLAAGLQQGGQRGLAIGEQLLGKTLEKKLEKKGIAEKLAMLQNPEYAKLFKDIDPRLAGIAQMAAAGLIEPGVATSMSELIRHSVSDKKFVDALAGITGEKVPEQRSPSGLDEFASPEIPEEISPQRKEPRAAEKKQINYSKEISDWQQLLTAAKEPHQKALVESKIKQLQQEQKTEQKKYESERGYHTQFSKPLEEKMVNLRESIPRKENALNYARNAIESGDLKYFSPDKLADATGIDLFRTAKGAQLITAGKENLLGNMSRTSARAQNMWFEQRLNSMFPKIGQSKEANLTTQEMLEGEIALDKLYAEAFDRTADLDQQKFGFVRKDIDQRVRNTIKDQEKTIFNRSMYRIRELEENEMGIEKLRNKVGKNVVKGTPLTMAMAKLYKDKFGSDALAVARKNGYTIPTIEEFQIYKSHPQEFREGLVE